LQGLNPTTEGTVAPYRPEGRGGYVRFTGDLAGVSPANLIRQLVILNPSRKTERRQLIDKVCAFLHRALVPAASPCGHCRRRSAPPGAAACGAPLSPLLPILQPRPTSLHAAALCTAS
jgi:hypothetical protein